ncbi:MAG: hypothetical protein WCJ30_11635 [Deltaproteobacteria bacterium]
MTNAVLLATASLAYGARAHAQAAPAAPWRETAVEQTPALAASPLAGSAVPREYYGTTPDPAFTHNFQMPTARPLHQGDTMVTAMGATGWLGVRYGFARRFDAGAGVPYYGAGVSFDARYAIILGDHAALSLWGYATVPFVPGGNDPGAFFGFTWRGAGPAWVVGPVVSLWGARAGIHVGAHVAQRVLMGGAWALVHVTVEVRVVDSVRAIAQGVVLGEMVDEQGASGSPRVLLGNGQPRVYPYLVLGARVHSRRFAVDFGALVSFVSGSPLAGGVPGVWPWAAVCQTF